MNPRLFGCAVSTVDDILVVGAPSVSKKGCIHTYKISERGVEDGAIPLFAPNGHTDDGFGISCKLFAVSPSEIYMIVGAHRKVDSSISTGAAYIYSSTDTGNSWKFIDQLSPNVTIHKSFFGCSVDINDTTAVVGAYGDNTEGWRVGSASVFNKTESGKWECLRTLFPGAFSSLGGASVRPTCSYFGFSVAISGAFIAVGSPSERSDGSVYVFHAQDGWDSTVLSHCIDGDSETRFGFSVDVCGENLVVGSPGSNGSPGKTCVYNMSAFYDASLGFVPASRSRDASYCEIIRTKSTSSKALFGRSVTVNDNFIVVSGFGKHDETFVGSAFVYRCNNGDDTIEPIACLRDRVATELFGHSVSVNDSFVVVGDPSSDNVHVYILRNIMNGHLKKWHISTHCIHAPQEFLLEIH